jgi:predicted enzyme related to lactoylglutathione lyase
MRFFVATIAVANFAVALVSAASAQGLQLPPLNTPATGEQLPGKFVWFDMATPAIADQQSFYGSVFGWSFDSPVRTEDGYVLVKNQGRAIAGMFSYEPPDGEKDGATWIALMSVLDPDHAASIVTANGGTVEGEAATVAGRGRHALFRDPAGAIFGVLRSDSGDPFDDEVEVGGIIWVDLFARDIDAMTKFYSALAPYEVADRDITEDLTRKIFSAHGMPRAGIVPVDEEANRSAWVPYVRVDDVAATLEKVLEGGGFTIVQPNEELFEGNVAVFVDPNGGVTGIVRYEYDEDPAP